MALAGIGKIARDQHVPTIAASDRFELVAAVTAHQPPDGVPVYRSIAAMMAADPKVDAIAICTPPIGRRALPSRTSQACVLGFHQPLSWASRVW